MTLESVYTKAPVIQLHLLTARAALCLGRPEQNGLGRRTESGALGNYVGLKRQFLPMGKS